MVNYISFLVLFLVYAYLDGIREAYYYHSAVKTGDSTKHNIHSVYYIQRGILFSVMAYFLNDNIYHLVGFIISAALCFSFIHNGIYYSQRNKLDSRVYPLKWKSESNTSTSLIEFTYNERLIQFILGVLIFIFSIIL